MDDDGKLGFSQSSIADNISGRGFREARARGFGNGYCDVMKRYSEMGFGTQYNHCGGAGIFAGIVVIEI